MYCQKCTHLNSSQYSKFDLAWIFVAESHHNPVGGLDEGSELSNRVVRLDEERVEHEYKFVTNPMPSRSDALSSTPKFALSVPLDVKFWDPLKKQERKPQGVRHTSNVT